MSFTVGCNYCNAELEAEDEMIGRVLSCPNCNNSVKVIKPTLRASSKKIEKPFPGECVAAGIIMITVGVLAILSEVVRDPWSGKGAPLPYLAISVLLSVVTSIAIFGKNKIGLVMLIISTVFGSIDVLFFLLSGAAFKNSVNVVAFLITISVVGFLGMASASYNSWLSSKNSDEASVSCPNCETKLVIKKASKKSKIKCIKCEETIELRI